MPYSRTQWHEEEKRGGEGNTLDLKGTLEIQKSHATCGLWILIPTNQTFKDPFI